MKILPRTFHDLSLVVALFIVPLTGIVSAHADDFWPSINSESNGVLNGKAVITSIIDNVSSTTKIILGNNNQETEPTKIFKKVSLSSKAAVVYDLTQNKIIYGKNENIVLPLASITKVMTGLVALEKLNRGEKVIISDSALSEQGDSGLVKNEIFNLDKLVDFTLVTSSNDGATALAEVSSAITKKSFTDLMNEKASQIGLKSMRFNNPTGLDVNKEVSGGYGSALDVAMLFNYAMKNEPRLLDATKLSEVSISSDGYVHNAKNTDTAIDKIPGLIASKTGFTDLAGGNVAAIVDVGIAHPVAIVVLGSNYDGRFRDLIALSSSTYDYFK